MTKKINKPNGVLFKINNGNLCICLLIDDKWDWDNVKVFKSNRHDDISTENPFEFVFITWNEDVFITDDKKSSVPNSSFDKLMLENKLHEIISLEYKKQYNNYDV